MSRIVRFADLSWGTIVLLGLVIGLVSYLVRQDACDAMLAISHNAADSVALATSDLKCR